jgi:hypothetical protein
MNIFTTKYILFALFGVVLSMIQKVFYETSISNSSVRTIHILIKIKVPILLAFLYYSTVTVLLIYTIDLSVGLNKIPTEYLTPLFIAMGMLVPKLLSYFSRAFGVVGKLLTLKFDLLLSNLIAKAINQDQKETVAELIKQYGEPAINIAYELHKIAVVARTKRLEAFYVVSVSQKVILLIQYMGLRLLKRALSDSSDLLKRSGEIWNWDGHERRASEKYQGASRIADKRKSSAIYKAVEKAYGNRS